MINVDLKPFNSFLRGPAKSIRFTTLFYSLWYIVDRITTIKYELDSFSERQIGIATLENFDVGARVELFYTSVFTFFFFFFLYNLIGYFIYKKNKNLFTCSETKLINYASVAGLILLIFKLFETEVYETQEIIYFLHKFMLLGVLLRLVFFKTNQFKTSDYLILICVSFAVYFFVIDINNLMGYAKNPDFYIVSFIIACALFILSNIYLNSRLSSQKESVLNNLSYVFFPLMSLPIISILKDEIFLILKFKNIVFNSQWLIYCGLFVLILLAIYVRHKKTGNQIFIKSDILAKQYFPMLIFSLCAFIAYNQIADYYDEIFESSNVYLPIMEFQLFGVLSPIEKLNTHLLSDYFFGAIYTFFNGLKISEVDLYDFLLVPISYTLFYYLIYYLTLNSLLSFFSVIIFPFAEAIMPGGYCLGIVAIFAFQKIINGHQQTKNYIIYFLIMLLLLVWRIDLAYVGLVAMPSVLLYYHFNDQSFRINWKTFFKGFAFVFLPVLFLLLVIVIYRQINLLEKGLYFLNYISSAQSYGYNTIGWSNIPGYKMHYFVFPIILGMAMISGVLNHKSLNINKTQKRVFFSFLFISLFYILNFNRGLIRHSIIEWTDTFASSFVYIILACLPFIFWKKQNQTNKAIGFCIISFLTVSSYRVPDIKGLKSQFESMIIKLKTTNNINLSKIKSRVKNKPVKATVKYDPFISFISQNTKTDETFIDFANKGMLYFYTQKVTPSWFYQNPLCIQNDFLQTHFISDLKKYKTPYLLFSGLSELGYDQVDQVPNTLRHYRMAEYFYQHFQPYVILGNYCVWKQIGVQSNNKMDTIINFNGDATKTNLKYSIQVKTNKKYLAKVVYKKAFENINPEINFISSDTGFAGSSQYYRVSENAVYCMFDFKKNNYTLNFRNFNHAIDTVLMMECDLMPDITMQRFLNYNFRKLPYVWAHHDAFVQSEKILFKTEFNYKDKQKFYKVDLNGQLDKSSGNAVLISVLNTSQQIQKLNLAFGKKGDKNSTNINIEILPSKKAELYAIRISSIYKWYNEVSQISIEPEREEKIVINSLAITKGLD